MFHTHSCCTNCRTNVGRMDGRTEADARRRTDRLEGEGGREEVEGPPAPLALTAATAA